MIIAIPSSPTDQDEPAGYVPPAISDGTTVRRGTRGRGGSTHPDGDFGKYDPYVPPTRSDSTVRQGGRGGTLADGDGGHIRL